MKLNYIVKSDNNFDNLKELLKVQFEISDRLLLKLKRNNKIQVNGMSVSPNNTIKVNDQIEVNLDFIEDYSNFPSVKMDLDILYEDECLLIVNKPAGIPVHPSLNHFVDSLANGVKYYFDSIELKRKIRPVNRIDKDTSGIVIFAKNEYVQEFLVRQMKSGKFTKEYIAICDGIFESKKGIIDKPIARKTPSIIERCISDDGDSAITDYEVLQEFNNENNPYSVIKCNLKTGRTHQIRVHMQYIGHSILGDTLYGYACNLISRQALHSFSVSFIHPISRSRFKITAPLPSNMKSLCSNLELYE